jgi:uncharacterized protein associated with vWA-MoxR-VMAP ternary system
VLSVRRLARSVWDTAGTFPAETKPMTIERRQVLWIGPAPTNALLVELKRRDLILNFVKQPLVENDFIVSCAIVFCFDVHDKGASIGAINAYASLAGDHGLLIIVRASDDTFIRIAQGHLTTVQDRSPEFSEISRPIKQFAVRAPAYQLAEWVVRHPAGPPLNPALQINGVPSIAAGDSFLLKRAFSDCKLITLEPLGKGLSGARVFAVYAEFPEGEAAPYPLPYFAKIDGSERVLREYSAYDRFVSRYVPFNQRPNFDTKRCILGVTDGILVGDFIDGSEALADVMVPNGARNVIHSLFDDALRGWRQQSYRRNDRVALLPKIRPDIVEPERIKQRHFETAKMFGAKMSPEDLVRLVETLPSHQYRRGPVHGDLNTQNIRVRGTEAVLIDFYKANVGPLVADLASLEVAICFSMEADIHWNLADHSEYERSARFTEWRRHIDQLFVVSHEFAMVPPLQEQPCSHTWMWSACRQLRLMAHYIEPEDSAYARVLALYMLRMAMFPEDESAIVPHSPDSIVRSYAYVAAERILKAVPLPGVAA